MEQRKLLVEAYRAMYKFLAYGTDAESDDAPIIDIYETGKSFIDAVDNTGLDVDLITYGLGDYA